jgi:hypothetical protein
VKLKKLYSSREVAAITGLTARQLQWWDARRLFTPAVAAQRTEAGGFTERRYTPLDVLELQVLAELRRRGVSVPRLRRLIADLRHVFGIRLYEAIGEGGPLTLMVGGNALYVRDTAGRLFDLDEPSQPLLVSENGLGLRVLVPRARRSRTPALRRPPSGSGRPSPGRQRAGESRARR